MATTSSLGVGTGIDLQTMLTKIMAAERAPITALGTKIAIANTKISVYGTLKSKLDALQSAAETLRFPSRLAAITASSSDAAVVTASASYTASVGAFSTKVTQLASAQKSFSVAYNAGTTFAAGNLTFTFGPEPTPPALDTRIPKTITTTANSTLQEVRDQINSAKIGVTATVITDSSGKQRMVLTGEKSGDGDSFKLASTLTPSGSQVSLASFDTSTAGLMRATAQDGKVELDGIEISSSTNSFATGVSGLTLTAVKLGTANISVQNDSTKITTAAQAFVDSYNAVVSLVKSNTGYDAKTKTGQALTGDSAVRSVISNLGSARTTTPTELSAATFKSLSELGISIQQSGLLTLDSTKLNTAISTSPTEVIKTLSAYGQKFGTAVSAMQDTGGVVASRLNSLNSSVTRFQTTQTSLEYRVSLIEKRYQAQFTALDKYVSAMNVTSSALTQQLAGLTGSSS